MFHTMASGSDKQYGLIIPGQKKSLQNPATRKLNPLLDSDDELENDDSKDAPLNWVEESLKKSAGNAAQKSLQRRMLREALEEDASVFQYDEVYDDIKASNAAQLEKKKTANKKPKYLENIMKNAEKRKLENERRQERKIQKEREEEGDEFKDKEAFVTPAYLKKLEEMKKAEAEEKLEQMREEGNDVLKHKNFGVFYNHLFKQRLGEDIKKEPEEPVKLRKDEGAADKRRSKHYRTQRDLSESPQREVSKEPKIKKEKVSSDSEDEDNVVTEGYRGRRERYAKQREAEKRSQGFDNRQRSGEKENTSRRVCAGQKYKRRSRSRSRNRRSRSRSPHYHQKRSRSRSPRHHRRSKSRSPRNRRRSKSKSPRNQKRSRSRSPRNQKRSRSRSPRNQKRSRSRSPRNLKESRSGSPRNRRRSRSRSPKNRRRSRSRSPKNQRRSRSFSPHQRGRSRSQDRNQMDRSFGRKSSSKSPHQDRHRNRDHNRKQGKSSQRHAKPSASPKSRSRSPKAVVVKEEKKTPEKESSSGKDSNAAKPVMVKKENEQDEKEKRMERILKIFAKRTVGEKYELALQKYYERKAEREANGVSV